MGYTGWLMPDGVFFPCGHKEHRETLLELLEMPQYKELRAKNIERWKWYNHEPEGSVCFWDTDFKFASFEGEMTKPVEEFLIEHFSEFNDEQKRCIHTKFYFLKNKTKEQEDFLKRIEKYNRNGMFERMVQEKLTKNNIVWQLPMASVDNTGYIRDNVKPHAFAVYNDESSSRSLCKKYSQWTKDYEEINIEGVEEKYLCKKCLERYKKLD